MLEAEKVDKEFMDFLQRQRSQAVRRLAEYSDRWVPLDSPKRRVVPRSPPHHAPDFPAGMVYVPGTKLFAMRIEHHQNEVACYPDREEAPWEERQYFMYAHMHRRVVAHHRVIPEIKPFLIDQNLVTNAEFKEFLSTTHYRPSDSQNFLKDWGWSDPADPRFPATRGRHPVVWVDIDDARAYAVWRGKRLPTEEEWQYAAGGWEEMRYPWGYEWSLGKANDNGRATTPVGAFPEGASPFGVLDMSGNVWQWTESERQDNITRYVMLRGGSYWQVQGAGWNFDRFKDFHFSQGEISARPVQYHTKFFLLSPGMNRKATIGFRCVKDLE